MAASRQNCLLWQHPATPALKRGFGLSPKSAYVANYQDKNHMQKRLSQLTVELEQIEDEANHTLQALHHSLTRRTLKPLIKPLLDKRTRCQRLSNILTRYTMISCAMLSALLMKMMKILQSFFARACTLFC